jgi:hypothetical protein
MKFMPRFQRLVKVDVIRYDVMIVAEGKRKT